MIKYSIIIPAYNCETTIEKCLFSILEQAFSNFELIVVDDCSTDRTYEICNRIALSNPNVRVFKNSCNKGVAFSRNYGIDKSCGNNILFVDSDDYVTNDYFSTIENSISDKIDLLSFGHFEDIHENKTIKTKISDLNVDFVEGNSDKWKVCFKKSFFASVWNKVYSARIVKDNNIRFENGCVCFEDFLFNLDYLLFSNKFVFISTPIYHYKIVNGLEPALKRKWGKRFDISNLVFERVIHFLEEKKEVPSCLVMPYCYSAFVAELKFAKFSKLDFDDAFLEVYNSDNFLVVIKSMKPKGKKIMLLLIFIKLKMKYLAKKMLEKMIK